MCDLSISNDVDKSLFLQAFDSYDAIAICCGLYLATVFWGLLRHKLDNICSKVQVKNTKI